MEYFRDVLLGQSFRERMWSIVKGNTAYKDIETWLRTNRCPRVYDAETVKTANECGIHRHANGNVYEGGKVLDPKNGKSYQCKISLDGKDKLIVRGYIGISLFGRSQTWVRF
jgi:uncharacterized protein (DUF2147 family)